MQNKYKFKGSFRNYQKRILDNLDNLFSDRHLHIVAAPGSGKTILGLEVISRLNKSALILAPTIAIRDQWIKRFETYFTDEDITDIVSKDFYNPKFLTVITYQGLHSVMSKVSEYENEKKVDSIESIKKYGIGTICLDEAHHLRNQWQQSLTKFIDEIRKFDKVDNRLHYISLTATPPYDSTFSEWNRYMDICGEVDEEITIPELVATGDLCPHQDYVYINMPTREEHKKLQSIWELPFNAINKLYKDGILEKLSTELSKKLKLSDDVFEKCLDIEESTVGFTIILKHFKIKIPKELDAILCSNIPMFKFGDAKTQFLTNAIENSFDFILNMSTIFNQETFEKAFNILDEFSLIKKENDVFKVVKNSDVKTRKIVVSSVGKLKSICDIVNSEIEALDKDLRQVILTDNIYAKELDKIGTDKLFTKVGATPIFETIRRSLGNDKNSKRFTSSLALLTGSLILVHKNRVNSILECGEQEFGSKWKKPSITDVGCRFVKLDFPKSTAQSVPTLTKAFNKGIIKIIVGTAALLGEGWDAPTINSLILASFVKTYMLSNQMRGRAIRYNHINPNKVANIWHLLTVDSARLNPLNNMLEMNIVSEHDLISLSKRMENLCALDAQTLPKKIDEIDSKQIELNSGLERCFDIDINDAFSNYEETNKNTLERSKNRKLIYKAWKSVIESNSIDRNYESKIKVEYVPRNLGVLMINAIDLLFVIILFFIINVLQYSGIFLQLGFRVIDPRVTFVLVTSFVLSLKFLGISMHKYITNLYNAKKRYTRQANALLNTLQSCGIVKSKDAKLAVKTSVCGADVSLVNATMAEKTIFAQCIFEFSTAPINPRYLLLSSHFLGFLLPMFAQSVPSVLSYKRETVDIYVEELNRAGLKVSAIYTRSKEGRKKLLKARKYALVNIVSGDVNKRRS